MAGRLAVLRPEVAVEAPVRFRVAAAQTLAVGTLLVALINVAAPAAIWMFGSSEITWSYLPLGVAFPFFVLVAGLNPLLKKVARRWAFSPGQLLVILAMMLVGITMPVFFMGFALSIISSPDYFATPENDWHQVLHPHLKRHLVPDNSADQIRYFYEGLPEGMSIPWGAWAPAMFWWCSFFAAFFGACFCLVSILRRAWVEDERLTFPMMELPLALVREDRRGGVLPNLLRSRLFWLGFALPATALAWNVVHYFFPGWPLIRFAGYGYPDVYINLGPHFPPLRAVLMAPVVAFAFLANAEVTFSVWFFVIVSILEEGLLNYVGFSVKDAGGFVGQLGARAWQSYGAFCVVVLWSLWIARHHLKGVVRRALGLPGGRDDSGEFISYRAAAFGLAFCSLYMLAWWHAAGMEWKVVLLFGFAVMIIYTGLSRIVAQTGLYYLTPPLVGEPFAISTLGSANLQPSSVIALGYQYAWHGDVQTTFMPEVTQTQRLGDAMGSLRRLVPAAIGLATVTAFIASAGFILVHGYSDGAYNFPSWTYQGGGTRAFGQVLSSVTDPKGVEWLKVGCWAFGALLAGLLTFLRYRFTWWPLNPVGLALPASWAVNRIVMSVFIGWACKFVILKLGGGRLYEAAKPFFFGLVLGHFFMSGVSFIVDIIWFPGQGHPIFNG